ncbi:MAG: BrnT family toxin [Gammaproteobacteria bacterium]|nr:BrnT family toxin [Gammaproteobacteria bacterium]
MRADYDPAKAAGNLRKHKVSFADAEGVLQDPMALTVEDCSSTGEKRFISIGLGSAGAILLVVYTEHGDGYRLISARRPSRREREQYES